MTILRRAAWQKTILAVPLLLTLAGCKVHAPGRLETALAQQIKRKITVGGKANVNPLPATQDNIRAGRENFSH